MSKLYCMGCGIEVNVSSGGFCDKCWQGIDDNLDWGETPENNTKLNHGYIFRIYDSGTSQIDKPRPYDDADYYTAKTISGRWCILFKGKIERIIDTIDINNIAEELYALNKPIKARMVHN